ncbi:MAG: DNA-binding transcriptional regulator Fis [Chromatiales bacterium]|jgi:Fis family transcriptional regulator
MSFDASQSQGALDHFVAKQAAREPLRDCVREAVDHYFAQMSDHEIKGLYQMVMSETEQPLLESVMEQTRGNQSKAANVLGISRSTLRKKLALYHLD